jgi:hypothetical protein
MTLYRRLTLEELSLLEKEFIEFLVVQGIEAAEWEKLKVHHSQEAEQLIDNFSDMVLDTTLSKIKFLEFISPTKIHIYQCLPEQLVLVAIEANENAPVDFTDEEKRFLYIQSILPELNIYTSSKKYHPTRSLELFKLTQLGSLITDDQLFKKVAVLLS